MFADSTPPPLVAGFSLGFDPVSQRLILQGGSAYDGTRSTYVDSTWAWDGRSWRELSPTVRPPAEAGASMAIDPVSGHLLLMGGDSFSESVDANGNNVAHWSGNDGTWSWTGSTWSRIANNPRQGGQPALTVDEASHELVVNCPDIRGIQTTDDLETGGPSWYGSGSYRWTGSGWAAMGSLPVDLVDAAAAYDPISKRVIQYGGQSQYPHVDTWAYNGTAWNQLHPAANPNLPGALAATDETTGQIVLLGSSSDGRGETWTWDGVNWVQQAIPGSPPAAGNGARLLWDPAISRVVLVAASGSNTRLQMWVWQGATAGWVILPF